MRLIKPAIVVLALTVLVTSIGSLLLGWQLNSLTSSVCMLLLGLILLQAQNSGPGERSLPPSGVRLLGAVGVILSGLMIARGQGQVAGLGGQHDDRGQAARRGGVDGVGESGGGGAVAHQQHPVAVRR